jgi:predicted transcriptional regulator
MAYENDLQMHFVNIGLEEGVKRGKEQAYKEIAAHMKALGVSVQKIAALMGVEESVVEALLS